MDSVITGCNAFKINVVSVNASKPIRFGSIVHLEFHNYFDQFKDSKITVCSLKCHFSTTTFKGNLITNICYLVQLYVWKFNEFVILFIKYSNLWVGYLINLWIWSNFKKGLYKWKIFYIKMDLLEQAIQNKDTKMITFLLGEDPRLIHHVLSNGSTVLQHLINN